MNNKWRLTGDKLVKEPEIEKPKSWDNLYVNPTDEDFQKYNNALDAYEAHTASLPSLPASAFVGKFPDGAVLEEWKDFEVRRCKCKIGDDCPNIKGKWFSPCIVAVPIEQPVQEGKAVIVPDEGEKTLCFVKGKLYKPFGHFVQYQTIPSGETFYIFDDCGTVKSYKREIVEPYAESPIEQEAPKEEGKSAKEFLWEYGIDIMSMDDHFNCQLLTAMERYAEQYHLQKNLNSAKEQKRSTN